MQKLALVLSFLTLLVSCNVEPLETVQNTNNSDLVNTNGNSNVELDNNFSNTEVITTFMSANINGFQFDNLKPLDYLNETCKEISVHNFATEDGNFRYLLLQGSNTTINGVIDAQSLIINIRIPQSQWALGTYELQDVNSVLIDGNNSCVEFYDLGRGIKTELIEQGTITITEFDLANKRIRGTFSLTYYQLNNSNAVEGPFELTTGTFNYKLDDTYFL